MIKMDQLEGIEDLLKNDKIVFTFFSTDGAAEDCLRCLCEERLKLFERISQLEAIAPRKIVTADGKVFVYRCPVDLIPEVKVGGTWHDILKK